MATQHQVLRMKHFTGDVDKVVNYMTFIAEDVRRQLAMLGLHSLQEAIGRTDLLQQCAADNQAPDKQAQSEQSPAVYRTAGQRRISGQIDLSRVLSQSGIDPDAPQYGDNSPNEPFDRGELAEHMVRTCLPAIEHKRGGQFDFEVSNTQRSIGARLSGEIAARHGDLGMQANPITINLTGSAGQSFGVWNAGGLHLHLEGEANDYVGKGMAGGKIVIKPPAGARFQSHQTTIVGNTCLYGATGGHFYAAGLGGERFAVRNSGATAVIEGVGDHGCEYMTGGCVAVLGDTGVNFGAGMTGGLAFVFDRHNLFVDRYNHELIDIHRIHAESMEAYRHLLTGLIESHQQETGSEWSRELLDNFYSLSTRFWLIKPKAAELSALLSTLKTAA